MTAQVTILFTSVGRRVALVACFREALTGLGLRARLLGADVTRTAPAMHVVDHAVLVPACDDPAYVGALRELCRREGVQLVVPLIDPELPVLAAHRDAFAERGTRVLISSPRVAELARDKRLTHEFFASHGLSAPGLLDPERALADGAPYPVVIKPRRGSAAKGVHRADSPDELRFWLARVPDPIVQEYVPGAEHTLDLLLDFQGTPLCVVPRRRLEVRAGEVSKAVTVREPAVLAAGWEAAAALGRLGALGPVTVQGILTPDGEFRLIEINPRFGGGYPLAFRAGANYPRWLVQMVLGVQPDVDPEAWQAGLAMLRYDDAVFVARDALTCER